MVKLKINGTARQNIGYHLSDILSKELNKNSLCKKLLHTEENGKNAYTFSELNSENVDKISFT